MEWAENNDADYIFGLAGNAALDAIVAEVAVNLRFHHAMGLILTCRGRCGTLRRVRRANASKASDISGCEGLARRGSILFRCERTYSCAVTLRAKINAAESCLTKQRWLLLLQPAKNREHISLAAL